jgi:hypothetical protein
VTKQVDVLQGTLFMLILKAVSPGAATCIRGAAAHPADFERPPGDSNGALCIPPYIAWSTKDGSQV